MHNLGYKVVPQEVLMKSEVLSCGFVVRSLLAVDEHSNVDVIRMK